MAPNKKNRNVALGTLAAVLLACGIGYKVLERPEPVVTPPPVEEPAPQPEPDPGPITPSRFWIGTPGQPGAVQWAPPTGLPPQREAWANVYPWHRAGRDWEPGSLHAAVPDFNGNGEPDDYDSADPRCVRWNLNLFREAGIDVAMGCWWGPYERESQTLPYLTTKAWEVWVDVCEQEGFAHCAELDDLPGADWGAPQEVMHASLTRSMTYIEENWAHLPHYKQLDGRPVVVIYDRILDKLGGALESNAGPENRDVRAAMQALGPWMEDCYLVFMGVGGIQRVTEQTRPLAFGWYNIPFANPVDTAAQYAYLAQRPDLDCFAWLFYAWDNTATRAGQRTGGFAWPASGPSLPFAVDQVVLALNGRPEVLVFPTDEFGERSSWLPTQERGRVYFDLMKQAIAAYKAAP